MPNTTGGSAEQGRGMSGAQIQTQSMRSAFRVIHLMHRRRPERGAGLAAAFFYPAFALVVAVSFFPLFYAVRESLHRTDYLDLGDFVGFANYRELFSQGGGLAFVSTSILFVLGTLALSAPIGVGLGLLLARPIRFRGFFRAVLMFPWVVSELVTGFLWMWFYDGRLGPIASLLNRIGIDFVSPLTSPSYALVGLVLANTWHSYPLVMVLTLAALQTVPAEVLEAARIDSPSGWQRFIHVTLPLIRNTILVALVLTTLHTFNNVTLIVAMTGGGPVGATDVLGIRVFKEAFQFYNMDVASTIAVVIFTLNIIFSIFFVRILRGEKA
jgi:ABC-type sugar transport system permease subunit